MKRELLRLGTATELTADDGAESVEWKRLATVWGWVYEDSHPWKHEPTPGWVAVLIKESSVPYKTLQKCNRAIRVESGETYNLVRVWGNSPLDYPRTFQLDGYATGEKLEGPA